MPALVAGVHVSGAAEEKTWVAGTSPAMASRSGRKKAHETIITSMSFFH
jgi:hypothetical protein